ncbi:MAG: putative Fe-S oxidoreductase [Caldanaerobacter subterraneus]|nr:MAG: putative Fe-S oxidoreductase [Caldanaerobacter subterraneus]
MKKAIVLLRILAKLMESLGISEVMISLEGASAQIHDAIRGQGSFARTMGGVEILRKYCSNIFLGCTNLAKEKVGGY